MWDVDLSKRLRHGATTFDLSVAFKSSAQRLVVCGPSGAGKTQSLKLVAGLVRPDSGHIQVAGRTVYDAKAGIHLAPQCRQLGVVFQDYALFPHLTVRQNIAFATRTGWLNPTRAAPHDRVDHWINTFGLQATADLYPHQISGGQRQRVALARALVVSPTALLLDEPFAALEKPLRLRLRDELAELQRSLKIPMLTITHDEDDVAALADDVVFLQSGRVVAPEHAARVDHGPDLIGHAT